MTRLIADIGATNARFAIADGTRIAGIDVLACADYPTLAAAARAYMERHKVTPDSGAFAMAMPLDGSDRVAMTNHSWSFSIEETRVALGLSSLKIINDFTAIALAIPYLSEADRYKVGNGVARPEAPVGIIGPGTGLGVAGIVFANGKPLPLTTEGGHVTMAAQTQREFDLFDYLRRTKYHHVSAERVVSGKGLGNLHAAICGVDGKTLPEITPAEITQKALEKSCAVCEEALDLFCHFLGVAAGNLALSIGAAGGIYIAGGIVPQLGDYFKTSRFRESFVAKGRYREYMDKIPTFVVTHSNPGLEGLRRI